MAQSADDSDTVLGVEECRQVMTPVIFGANDPALDNGTTTLRDSTNAIAHF